jgi:hypothetical protein
MITVTVHSFILSDVDDPEVYAAEPLYKWQISEKGQWIMKNSTTTPTWYITPLADLYSHTCIVKATLSEKNYTYWKLKYE